VSDAAKHLLRQFENGRVILFAGAGFSLGCKDQDGKNLPTGGQLARELWNVTYPDIEFDEWSSLQDIFEVAQKRSPKNVLSFLKRRLSVDASSIPEWYATWLRLPWRRIYTLNVDDVIESAGHRFELGRTLLSISAQVERTHEAEPQPLDRVLEVVHLNGRMEDGLDKVTFSTTQYADRSTSPQPWHVQVATDIATLPVVFVGTPVEDQLLWQYLQLRGKKGPRNLAELRPQSYLVSPAIPRAREELLKSLNIEFLQMSAEEFAASVLDGLRSSISAGLEAVALDRRGGKASPYVVTVPTKKPSKRSLFLLGAEPEWTDIVSGLAIKRTADDDIARVVAAARRTKTMIPRIVVVTGTAGSGKTTSMMRSALAELALGHRVSWVGREEDISPAQLRRWADELERPSSIYIDDVDRYGNESSRVIDALRAKPMVDLIVVCTRSSKVERVIASPSLDGVVDEVAMPPLTDEDIDGLLEVLHTDGKLGKLRGLSESDQKDTLRSKCGRLLLVAMLEATSSQRFEEKVVEEYGELGEIAKTLYELISVSYSLRFPAPKSMLLVALGDASNEALNNLDALERRQLVVLDAGRYRPRHRVIADTLVGHLEEADRRRLAKVTARLTYAAAAQVTPPPDRSRREWRFLISLMNHERLLRTVDASGARMVYEEIETILDYDHHYWLQRGSLELEHGHVSLAENYLDQARSLDPSDYKIQTAYAYMLLKKASEQPGSTSAHDYSNEAIDTLESLIEQRGYTDYYVYHVLGSQGLHWVRKMHASAEQKVLVLRRLIARVQDGVNIHTRRPELASLLTALRRALLELTTGLVPAS
jgi:hypothetical protein